MGEDIVDWAGYRDEEGGMGVSVGVGIGRL